MDNAKFIWRERVDLLVGYIELKKIIVIAQRAEKSLPILTLSELDELDHLDM